LIFKGRLRSALAVLGEPREFALKRCFGGALLQFRVCEQAHLDAPGQADLVFRGEEGFFPIVRR
jgi:hypothetical protein